MKFYFKASGGEKTIYIESSVDVFSSNMHEISSYVSELGGYFENNSALLQSSEDLAKLTTKLLLL